MTRLAEEVGKPLAASLGKEHSDVKDVRRAYVRIQCNAPIHDELTALTLCVQTPALLRLLADAKGAGEPPVKAERKKKAKQQPHLRPWTGGQLDLAGNPVTKQAVVAAKWKPEGTCIFCKTPVYFYELLDPPTCMWCEKLNERRAA